MQLWQQQHPSYPTAVLLQSAQPTAHDLLLPGCWCIDQGGSGFDVIARSNYGILDGSASAECPASHHCPASLATPLSAVSQLLCRQLYPVLNQHAAYIGVWHTTADTAPRGALYSFRWAAGGVDVVQLVSSKKYLTQITHKRLCTLGPSHPRYQAEVIDGCKCVLRDYGSNSNGSFTCSTAEAAASVAAGVASSSWTSSGSDGPSGSSPGSSWSAELLRFMHSSVQRVGWASSAI